MERFIITANIKLFRKLLGEPGAELNRERQRQIQRQLAAEKVKLWELEQEEALSNSSTTLLSRTLRAGVATVGIMAEHLARYLELAGSWS